MLKNELSRPVQVSANDNEEAALEVRRMQDVPKIRLECPIRNKAGLGLQPSRVESLHSVQSMKKVESDRQKSVCASFASQFVYVFVVPPLTVNSCDASDRCCCSYLGQFIAARTITLT